MCKGYEGPLCTAFVLLVNISFLKKFLHFVHKNINKIIPEKQEGNFGQRYSSR